MKISVLSYRALPMLVLASAGCATPARAEDVKIDFTVQVSISDPARLQSQPYDDLDLLQVVDLRGAVTPHIRCSERTDSNGNLSCRLIYCDPDQPGVKVYRVRFMARDNYAELKQAEISVRQCKLVPGEIHAYFQQRGTFLSSIVDSYQQFAVYADTVQRQSGAFPSGATAAQAHLAPILATEGGAEKLASLRRLFQERSQLKLGEGAADEAAAYQSYATAIANLFVGEAVKKSGAGIADDIVVSGRQADLQANVGKLIEARQAVKDDLENADPAKAENFEKLLFLRKTRNVTQVKKSLDAGTLENRQFRAIEDAAGVGRGGRLGWQAGVEVHS